MLFDTEIGLPLTSLLSNIHREYKPGNLRHRGYPQSAVDVCTLPVTYG